MSANQGDDIIRIPIELKLEDSEEIRKLLQEIDEAESDLHAIRPRRGKGSGDQTSRSAFTSEEPRDTGIFGGGGSGDVLPERGRDSKSKTPFQRESEFSKLKNQVQEVERKQGTSGLDAVQGGIGGATQAVGFASLIGSRGGAGIAGALGGLASKAFLPLAIATSVISLVKGLLDSALAPGGPLDRRFRRELTSETANTASLEDKERINQGSLVVRTQLYSSVRGTVGVASNLDGRGRTLDIGLSGSMQGL